MKLTDSLKAMLIETARTLKGSARRAFIARTVKELGPGGQRLAERELGWSRGTIRKGMREIESGLTCLDMVAERGRKRAEVHLPNLLDDIRDIVESQRQRQPRCPADRRATCLSVVEVRRRLISQKGYTDSALPTVQTIATKLKALGYNLSRPQRSRPHEDSSAHFSS